MHSDFGLDLHRSRPQGHILFHMVDYVGSNASISHAEPETPKIKTSTTFILQNLSCMTTIIQLINCSMLCTHGLHDFFSMKS